MLEKSFGLNFFLKTPEKMGEMRFIYLRITVDGISKEMSTKRKWSISRWDQKSERAIGTKEDSKTLNFFLDSITTKINQYKIELINAGNSITAPRIMDFIQGKTASRRKVVEEFELHNSEILALVDTGEYAIGTHVRFETTLSHIKEFLNFKYGAEDIEFRDLNYEFITDLEFFLKTIRKCSHNTSLKYIGNFKKIVLRAIAKKIIVSDPFLLFKRKKKKTNKKPLTRWELQKIEEKTLSSERLNVVRDIFIFQCYTGLCYIDVLQLKKSDIKMGIEGALWIMSNRQKSGSETNIPILPKAAEIIKKYENDPLCNSKGTVLPVRSNQKMNDYLKEIAVLCDIDTNLNTHKARRTFASTVTLNNGVPIHVVKEMMGHHSVQQTEEYALTEQETVSREMNDLKLKLSKMAPTVQDPTLMLQKLRDDFEILKHEREQGKSPVDLEIFAIFEKDLSEMKKLFLKV